MNKLPTVFKLSAIAFTIASQPAFANLTNGDFENGLTGWTTTTAGGANPVAVTSGVTNVPNVPGATLQPSPTNNQYVYTSQANPGHSILTQSFNVQSGTNKVFFDIAIRNGAPDYATPDSLSFNGSPNQQARFDILKPGSAVDTYNPADIIVTVYKTEVGDPLVQNWSTKEVDVTTALSSYAGQNVIFRFWQADNQMFFNLAIDNVNVGLAQFLQLLSTLNSATTVGNSPSYSAAGVIDANSNLLALFTGLTGSDAAISNATTQTLPLLVGGSQLVSSASLAGINRVIQARLDGNRGLSAGDAFYGDRHFWIKPFGTWARQSDQGAVAGYKANTSGMVMGLDGTLSDALRAGVAFAWANSSVKSNSAVAPNSASVDVYQLVGYGSRTLANGSELNFQVDVGHNNNDGARTIAFTNTVAQSSFNTTTFHAGGGWGKSFAVNEKTTYTPSLRLDYTQLRDGAYTETGAGLLNLDVAKRTSSELVLGADAKVNHQLSSATQVSFNAGLGYDFHAKQANITATFAGAPGSAFVTQGINPEPWTLRAGLGLQHNTAAGIEITTRLDVEKRQGFQNSTASVKARWNF